MPRLRWNGVVVKHFTLCEHFKPLPCVQGLTNVRVAAKDSGIGISPEGQQRLFERFRQATPKTEEVYGGSGLGLNISRKICHLHGGEIGVASREGEGSEFLSVLLQALTYTLGRYVWVFFQGQTNRWKSRQRHKRQRARRCRLARTHPGCWRRVSTRHQGRRAFRLEAFLRPPDSVAGEDNDES